MFLNFYKNIKTFFTSMKKASQYPCNVHGRIINAKSLKVVRRKWIVFMLNHCLERNKWVVTNYPTLDSV